MTANRVIHVPQVDFLIFGRRLTSPRTRPETSVPKSPEDLLAYLGHLGIATTTVEHPPLHTVEDSRELRGDIEGAHCKNLFVKDKKSRLFLLVLEEEAVVDLKRVHEKIGAQGRVSFGSAELLEEVWGVRPGAVTPFGAINDHEGRVTVVLDAALMRHERLNFHPLVNTRTTGLESADLIKFLEATGHQPAVVRLDSGNREVE
jgi:Ala-tRNA(Pro) deacylase